jgi:phage baseplate assembly protein W
LANSSKTRGISFPFRKGQLSLPEANSGAQTVIDSVRSLLLTGVGEVPLAPSLGTQIHSFVFGNITPIQGARISQSIRSIISEKEPRMQVLSVTTEDNGDLSSGYRLVVNVTYRIADEEGEMEIPLV